MEFGVVGEEGGTQEHGWMRSLPQPIPVNQVGDQLVEFLRQVQIWTMFKYLVYPSYLREGSKQGHLKVEAQLAVDIPGKPKGLTHFSQTWTARVGISV